MADAARLVQAYAACGLTLGTAESLTAGLIAATVANVSGASKVLMGGVVSYDERIKRDVLGVDEQVIDTVGVVSAECARQMAEGARKVLGVDVAVSATGIAGPTGGTEETPVGTVFIGLAARDGTAVHECHFTGDRQQIREQTVQFAISLCNNVTKEGYCHGC